MMSQKIWFTTSLTQLYNFTI